MPRKRLLLLACFFCLIAGLAHAGEQTPAADLAAPATEDALAATPLVAEQSSDDASAADLWTTPDWAQPAEAGSDCAIDSGFHPLVPGDCNDCAGGCSIRCSNHATCMSRCPNRIGVCTLSGRCLCAC